MMNESTLKEKLKEFDEMYTKAIMTYLTTGVFNTESGKKYMGGYT